MNISILGCGWLGFPLAQHFIKENFTVNGSTTTPEKLTLLKQSGIHPHYILLPDSLDDPETDSFWRADTLFLNIPPGRNSKDAVNRFPSLIEKVVHRAAGNAEPWIIFASSTSVYSETGGLTKEKDINRGEPARSSGKALRKTETLLQNSSLDVTILRFGGLYGYDRHPVHYLSGKKNLDKASKPVNLVHQTDCIHIIREILKKERKNEVYNVVSDGHPPRREFYKSAAKHFNLPPPSFKKSRVENYKIVSNEKLKKDLGYSFIYPNPMDHTP
ncbi:MAG: hypothetical protein WEA56_15250 [Balneolaceae bacterium]